MAEAPPHDKEMEDLVGAEAFVARVENLELECIEHAAHGINDASRKEPQKARKGKCLI